MIYYAVALSEGNTEPIFAEIEEVNDNTHTFGVLKNLNGSYTFVMIVWYDFVRRQSYKFSHAIEESKNLQTIMFLVMANGSCCIWLVYPSETISVKDFNCSQIVLDESNIDWKNQKEDLQKRYDSCRSHHSENVIAFLKNSRITMNKYSYRLYPIVGGDKEIDLKGIDETLSDGTIKRMDDKVLFDYQHAAKPKKLYLNMDCNSSAFEVYIWFEENDMIQIFERFYGMHPETKTDFIIRIDAENKKYELALYRQGLKAPVVIPESAYQLIVFKNKFEDYRSENYNQPRGAWIW